MLAARYFHRGGRPWQACASPITGAAAQACARVCKSVSEIHTP